MKTSFLFSSLLLGAVPFARACGSHEGHEAGTPLLNLGFTGGVLTTLVVLAIVLAIVFARKNGHKDCCEPTQKMKGGKK